jgi:hypothetical protein
MAAILLALVLLGALTLVGAGPARACLPARHREAWPALAPVLGLALVVVASEGPQFFVPGRRYGAPLLAVLSVASLFLLARSRRTASRPPRGVFVALGGVLASLAIALRPQIGLPAPTTLSTGNYDHVYYFGLEHALRDHAYRDLAGYEQALVQRMAWLLRHGGWRSGISQVSVIASSVSGLPPHRVDGALWALAFALLPAASWTVHVLVAPRASRRARALAAFAAVLSTPPLMLLRETFASHVASLPLLLAGSAALYRGARARHPGLSVAAALLLAATLSVFADGFALLTAVSLALVAVAVRESGGRALGRAALTLAGLGALATFALVRMTWAAASLSVTGYHGPRTDPRLSGVGELLPTMVGLHAEIGARLEDASVVARASAWLGTAAALVLLVGLLRASRVARGYGAAVFGASGALLATLLLAGTPYPTWKLALTVSVFAPACLALGADALARHGGSRVAVAASAAYVGCLAVRLVAWDRTERDRVGVMPLHEQVAEAVRARGGEAYMVGHLASEASIRHEHPLGYLLEASGQPLHETPHAFSYYAVSRPWAVMPLHDGHVETAVVVDPGAAFVRGRRLGAFGPLELWDVSQPHDVALDVVHVGGFFEPELEPGRSFRWAGERATFLLGFRAGGCWTFDSRAAAGLPATVRVTLGAREERLEIGGDWRALRVRARDAWGVHRVRLDYEGPAPTIAGETRALRFSIGNLAWRSVCD